ncbi:endonuclease/exonuclease/phosphatase family protein [Chryseobacterium sp.]|uniref:endonuclease/exonuclease/phosphatase family protein n=1 Tax=Chryseobacterium sp. TaxID=1871047 RepID=UPI00388D8E17
MKIISWNCNMAFRKKAEFIFAEKPDILVVQECENLEKLKFPDFIQIPSDSFWYGKNKNKGIAVFTFSNFKIELLDIHNPDFEYVIPLSIKSDAAEYVMLAVWTQKPTNHDCYTSQIWNAIHYYTDLLKIENLLIIGDFNSNSIWDKPRRIYNHTNLVNKLIEHKIYSSYHVFFNEVQGRETQPTLYLHRKIDKPYHIDYCFISENLKNKLTKVEIGTYSYWTKLSDHSPLILEFI